MYLRFNDLRFTIYLRFLRFDDLSGTICVGNAFVRHDSAIFERAQMALAAPSVGKIAK
jgi:hypothetical protein